MGKGHGSLSGREAEVNINKRRRGNVKSEVCLGLEPFIVLFVLLVCLDTV